MKNESFPWHEKYTRHTPHVLVGFLRKRSLFSSFPLSLCLRALTKRRTENVSRGEPSVMLQSERMNEASSFWITIYHKHRTTYIRAEVRFQLLLLDYVNSFLHNYIANKYYSKLITSNTNLQTKQKERILAANVEVDSRKRLRRHAWYQTLVGRKLSSFRKLTKKIKGWLKISSWEKTRWKIKECRKTLWKMIECRK